MDIIGVKEVTAEAELLAAIVTFFKRVGLTSTDIGIKFSSRKVLDILLPSIGLSFSFKESVLFYYEEHNILTIALWSLKVIECVLDDLKIPKEVFAQTCIIVDKLDKLEKDDVIKQLQELGIEPDVGNKLIEALSVKSLDELASKIGKVLSFFCVAPYSSCIEPVFNVDCY